jgi:CRISPR-associated protein Csm5
MKLKLEVLTAVNIGSGNVLSQFSDYVYDNGFVYYLDHDRLLQELATKPNCDEMIDQFVMIVQNQATGNTQDRFKLKSFLEGNGLDYKKYALRKIPVSEEIKEQIQLHIKSGNQPYIPGSSLKGAIRTALISHLFSLEKNLKGRKGYIGEDIFGKYGEDVLKHLLVSDTMPFPEEELRIARFYKINLETKKTDIPVIKEVINRGSVSDFDIKTKAKNGEIREKFPFLLEGNEETLLGIINNYTQKNIEIELNHLQHYSEEETKALEEFYNRLLQAVTQTNPAKEAYLRIGSGKTYYDNTIAQKFPNDFLHQVIKNNFKKADPNFFPKTRTVIIDGSSKNVPGWIKITKI